MRVVVFGATGNVGLNLLGALSADERIESITGCARRIPDTELPKVTWQSVDITKTDLEPIVEGADAVVHLAWVIQPSHRVEVLNSINIDGSKRVFDAVANQGISNLVYASSIGAYSPGPKDKPVD